MPNLNQAITLRGLTLIAVGSCIGSGIFLTPSDIAGHLPNNLQILLVWSIGGIVALTGALTFAELGGMFTKSGGVYVYLKEAYGDMMGFLYGWSILTVITTGAIAALALAFARYIDFLVPLGPSGIKVVGILAILLVTGINVYGVKMGEIFASFFTLLKLAGIAFVVVVGTTYFLSESSAVMDINWQPLDSSPFALALIGVLWSYGGWHHASYLAGETINAPVNVPKAMFLGALIVTATYLLTNLAYLFLLPVDVIAGSKAVAADAVSTVFLWGGIFAAVLIALSTFGTAGIYTLSAPRIYYAMANDGVFFTFLTKVHPVWRTPINAILLQSGWAIVLLLFWGTFENLITYVVFMDWIFNTLAAISVLVFRRKRPDAPRMYKVFGYPMVPFIFIAISTWFLVYTLIGKPQQAWAGLILLALGTLFYRIFKKKK